MKPSTYVGYIRGSTLDQRTTLLAQYNAILRWASAFGHAMDQSVRRIVTLDGGEQVELLGCFIDAGVSAEKVDFLQRADAIAMLAHLASTGCRDIIGTKLDRVFRNVDDARFTVRAMEKRAIRFHLLDVAGTTVTTDTAMGQFMLTVLAAVAEFENRRRAERQRDAFSASRRRRLETGSGLLLGSEPYGWQAVPKADGKTLLVPHEFEQVILRRIIAGDLGTVSCNEAARRLNAECVPAKKGGKWFGSTVASVREHGAVAQEPAHSAGGQDLSETESVAG